MSELKIYWSGTPGNNATPTKDGTDGVIISEGTGLAPLETLYIADGDNTGDLKLALRCTANHQTSEDVTISLTGTNASWWQLANDDGTGSAPDTYGTAGADLTLTDPDITSTANVIFWAKVTIPSSTSAQNDDSVSLHTSDTIIAV